MKSIGVEVRELSELPGYYSEYKEIFDYYMIDGLGVGKACDLARMLIVYNEGGLYLDLDFYIEEWDANLNYYFDFYGLRDIEFYVYYLTTWGFAARSHHEIHSKYLEIFKENYYLPIDKKPFF